MKCAWQVEIDEFASKVLAKHWPEVKRYGDIREVGKHNLEPVDLICGGFPCQPFSVAGKRKGTDDDRHLWPEMLRVIAELKPTYVIGENVPGIIPLFLDQAISDLENQGYTCETFVLPAVSFDAPHRRDRLWIIAYSNSSAIFEQRSNAETRNYDDGRNKDVADPNHTKASRQRKYSGEGLPITEANEFGESGKHVANTNGERLQVKGAIGGEQEHPYIESCGNGRTRWSTEPDVGRVAHGVPSRVHRLRALGNAVVPQVVEFIGRMILEAERK